MATKQRIVIAHDKTVKAASFGGKASKKNVEMIIRRMYPEINPKEMTITTQDGRSIDLDIMADICNRNGQDLKFVIHTQKSIHEHPDEEISRTNMHSRNNSAPGKSVRQLVSSPEKMNWPEVLDSEFPTVLFNTTNTKKLSTLIESKMAQENANFLYRIIDNEFSEVVYLYKHGFLVNSIELNDNIELNLKAFFKTYASEDHLELSDPADQKDDHIPEPSFRDLLFKLELDRLMASADISALIRAYNVRPLLVKSMARDYFDDIIQLPALA